MAGGFIDYDDSTAEGNATKRSRSRRRSISSRSFPDAIVRLYVCRIHTHVYIYGVRCARVMRGRVNKAFDDGNSRRTNPSNVYVPKAWGKRDFLFTRIVLFRLSTPSPFSPSVNQFRGVKGLFHHTTPRKKINAPVTGLYLTRYHGGGFGVGTGVTTVYELTVERYPITNVTLKHATNIRYLNTSSRITTPGEQ